MYVRFVSKRGTVASSAPRLRDPVTPLTNLVRIATAPGTKLTAATWPLNSILRQTCSEIPAPAIIGGSPRPPTSRLLLACPDRPGLIAAVSGFLADAGLNIVDADQHSSGEGRLFMRMVFDPVPEGRARGRLPPLRGGGRRAARDGPPLRRVERAQAGRDHGLARGPLPLRPALALAQRRARRRRRRRRLQPPRPRRPGRLARPPLPPRPGRGRRQGGGRAARARAARRGRPARPRPLHAGPLGRLPRRARGAGDQHPPQLPARLRRRRPLPAAPTSAASS